jgi:glycine C-acetyltransferase
MLEAEDLSYLGGTTADFVTDEGADLLRRWDAHQDWWDGRLSQGLDSYSRSTGSRISTECVARPRDGAPINGVNFASQDYLGLSAHAEVHAAAKHAIDEYGVHSAGSAALMGNTTLSLRLERQFANFLGYDDCTAFPTGWGAGYGTIRTLVRPTDHVVIDVLAHACLQEGARNSTTNVHSFPHLSNEGVRRRLARIRLKDPAAGILVVTETVFSMDSDAPDIAGLQAICHEYGATLMLDVAHDLGAMGPTGRGCLEIQGMVGKVDIVMGSFSKTFASNGGFVASNARGLKLALRALAGPLTFTNALSPVSASIVSKALDIVGSPEGAARRASLLENIHRMRDGLERIGLDSLGQPSAIIPVILGEPGVSRLMTRTTLEAGGLVNLVEFPAVSRNSCRWRIQVMSEHTDRQIDAFVAIADVARRQHFPRSIGVDAALAESGAFSRSL